MNHKNSQLTGSQPLTEEKLEGLCMKDPCSLQKNYVVIFLPQKPYCFYQDKCAVIKMKYSDLLFINGHWTLYGGLSEQGLMEFSNQ